MKYLIPIPWTDPPGRIAGSIRHQPRRPAHRLLFFCSSPTVLSLRPSSFSTLTHRPIHHSIIYFIYTFNKRAYVPRHPANLWRWGSQAWSPWWPRRPLLLPSLSLHTLLGGKQLAMTLRASGLKGRNGEMTQGAESVFKRLIWGGSAGQIVSVRVRAANKADQWRVNCCWRQKYGCRVTQAALTSSRIECITRADLACENLWTWLFPKNVQTLTMTWQIV